MHEECNDVGSTFYEASWGAVLVRIQPPTGSVRTPHFEEVAVQAGYYLPRSIRTIPICGESSKLLERVDWAAEANPPRSVWTWKRTRHFPVRTTCKDHYQGPAILAAVQSALLQLLAPSLPTAPAAPPAPFAHAAPAAPAASAAPAAATTEPESRPDSPEPHCVLPMSLLREQIHFGSPARLKAYQVSLAELVSTLAPAPFDLSETLDLAECADVKSNFTAKDVEVVEKAVASMLVPPQVALLTLVGAYSELFDDDSDDEPLQCRHRSAGVADSDEEQQWSAAHLGAGQLELPTAASADGQDEEAAIERGEERVEEGEDKGVEEGDEERGEEGKQERVEDDGWNLEGLAHVDAGADEDAEAKTNRPSLDDRLKTPQDDDSAAASVAVDESLAQSSRKRSNEGEKESEDSRKKTRGSEAQGSGRHVRFDVEQADHRL